MKKILVIDNQDSFVYNLVEMLRREDVSYQVIKSDDTTFQLDLEQYAGVIFSPGGGIPNDYPTMLQIIEEYHPYIPMLGVCLGHQAIAQYFGAQLEQLPHPLHGHASQLNIKIDNDRLLDGVNNNATIGRYHSWVVSTQHLPATLLNIAADDNDNIMVIKHRDYKVWGVQFHPESIITDICGTTIIKNWLACCYQ